MEKRKFTVTGFYTIATDVDVEAISAEEAIELAKKKIGRTESEYYKVEFEVQEDFI